MATQKERELALELVNLVFDINEDGKVNSTVEVKWFGVEFRVYEKTDYRDWIYYSHTPAYFADGVFTEIGYENQMNEFIHEAKKHHPAYDSDGVKL